MTLALYCANKFVKLSKKSIPLAQALAKRIRIKENDDSKPYYHLPNIINIGCEGGWLNGHTEVKVIAKNGSKKMEVGKLMLYDNRVVKRAEIMLVSVVTQKGNRVVPKLKDYESYIKRRSFNQALIRAEIVKEITLDLTAPQYRNDKDVQTLLNTKDLEKYRDTLRTIFNKNLQLTKQFGVIDQQLRLHAQQG